MEKQRNDSSISRTVDSGRNGSIESNAYGSETVPSKTGSAVSRREGVYVGGCEARVDR